MTAARPCSELADPGKLDFGAPGHSTKIDAPGEIIRVAGIKAE